MLTQHVSMTRHPRHAYENGASDALAPVSCGLFLIAFSRQTSLEFFSRVTIFYLNYLKQICLNCWLYFERKIWLFFSEK